MKKWILLKSFVSFVLQRNPFYISLLTWFQMIILSLMFACFYIKRQFQLKLKVGVLAHSPIFLCVIDNFMYILDKSFYNMYLIFFFIINKSFYNMYNLGKSYLSGVFFIFFICSNVLINLYHFILLRWNQSYHRLIPIEMIRICSWLYIKK